MEEIKTILLFCALCILAYLMGSIPFGYWISRKKKVDIRQRGSGNIGAANVTRALGPIWGFVVVGGLDFLKGVAPGLLGVMLFANDTRLRVFVCLFCCLGSIFPCWLKFKGGKGVAVLVGGLLPLLGPIKWTIAIICCFIFFLLFARRRVSVASLVLAAGVLWPFGIDALPITFFVWKAHAGNIDRLAKGYELVIEKLPSIPDWTFGLSDKAIRIFFTAVRRIWIEIEAGWNELKTFLKKLWSFLRKLQ